MFFSISFWSSRHIEALLLALDGNSSTSGPPIVINELLYIIGIKGLWRFYEFDV
jgi:hypothetical protein